LAIELEQRCQEVDRVRASARPDPKTWVKWARFEENQGRVDRARELFQTALKNLGNDSHQMEMTHDVFPAFAQMETRLEEFERARATHKVGIDPFAHA
jgi:crooked neck